LRRLAREADRRALLLLRTRLRHRGLERALARYAWTGEYGRIWIALALGGAAADRPRRGRWLRAAAGVPLTLGLNYGVKRLVRRRRPRLDGIDPTGPVPRSLSFPSAHAATSFAAATQMGALSRPLRAPLLAAAAVMAFSRPYLGVHHPSDVVAGAAVGALIGRLLARLR
jgi:membrane-associated phospholipid phosphatase